MVVDTNSITSMTVKTAEQLKSDFLRTIKNGLINIGYPDPNTSPGTWFDVIAEGFSQEGAIISYNTQLSGDIIMFDTSTAANLDKWLNFFGIPRKQATSSIGAVIASASSNSLIPTGALLTVNGVRYAVVTGGVYGDGSSITVQSVDTGLDTNQDAGAVLQWVATPTYFNSTVAVSTLYPIGGGQDTEDDETARNRLSNYLSNTPGAQNAAQIALLASQSDPSVQFACVYPAARGPSTFDVTVFTYGTSTSQNRSCDPTLMSTKITPYLSSNFFLGADGYVSTVTDYPINVSIQLSLPAPNTAAIPGPGGGFIDPSPLSITTAKPAVRVVDGYAISGSAAGVPQNSATGFWIDCPVQNTSSGLPPQGVQLNISYLSPTTLTVTSAQTVVTNGISYLTASSYPSLSAHTSLIYIYVNTPFYNDSATNTIIQPGEWIFPTAVNTKTYVNTYINYLYSMGPGERTSNAGLLPRAYRQPAETQSYPYKLNTRMIKQIIESGSEVLDGVIAYRGVYNNAGTGQTPVANGSLITDTTTYKDYGSITTNSDPAYSVYSPPTAYLANGTAKGPSYIFTINNFGIYPL